MQAAQSSSLTRFQSQASQLKAQRVPLAEQVWQPPAEHNDPLIPAWLAPIALTGTAAVMTTAVLAAYDTGTKQDKTQSVPAVPLPEQIQLQAGSEDQGCSATCRDLKHVQTQIATLRRYVSERQIALQSLQAQVTDSTPQAAAQAIAQRLRSAEIQQERLEWEANALQSDLQQLSIQLGLPSDLSAVDILNQSPHYQQQWQHWQQLDRQIGEAAEVEALGSPVWNPKEHDRIAPMASREALLPQHQEATEQLQTTVKAMIREPIQRLAHFDQAIEASPLRLAYVKPWVTKAHRLQLVQGRQQTLQILAQNLQQQQHDWLQLSQREAFLQTDIAHAEQAIEAYSIQAQRLQNHLHANQQVVTPPDAINAL